MDFSSDSVSGIVKVAGPILIGVWGGIRELVKGKGKQPEAVNAPAKERPSSPRLQIQQPIANEGENAEVSQDDYNELCSQLRVLRHDVETLKRNTAYLLKQYDRMENEYPAKLDAIVERLDNQAHELSQVDRMQRSTDNRLAGIQGELKGISKTISELFQMVERRAVNG